MDINMLNKTPYINAKGTTCKSFKIGKTKLSFASKAMDLSQFTSEEKAQETYWKYKSMVVETDDNGNYVVYDCSIPMTSIRNVMTTTNNGKINHEIVLYNGDRIPLQNTSSAAELSWDMQPDDETSGQDKRILVYDTTNGKFQKSLYAVMTSEDLPKIDNASLTGVEKLQAIADVYEKDERDFDKQIPTMKTVIKYVGNFNDILASRLNGTLPGDADTH